MLAILLGLTMRTRFVVTHHVDLHDTLFWCTKARRDGSMVGSHGYEGPHDGGYDPLIILKGERIVIKDDRKLLDYQVQDFERNGIYIVSSDMPPLNYPAKFINGDLTVIGPGVKPKPYTGKPYKENPPDDATRKLFPPPRGMEDTTGIRTVNWQKWSQGIQLGQIEFSWNMDAAWRVALKDPFGRIQPLENVVPSLKGYEVRGLHWLEKDWILVSANKARPDNGSLTLGYGCHLFWIELR